MRVIKTRILLIFLGLIIVIFSNNIFDIFYPEVRPESFEITKTISIMFTGLIISFIGILFPFTNIPKDENI